MTPTFLATLSSENTEKLLAYLLARKEGQRRLRFTLKSDGKTLTPYFQSVGLSGAKNAEGKEDCDPSQNDAHICPPFTDC